MNATALRMVAEFALRPHPEGGYYREVFRSDANVIETRGRTRSALTVIYFLLADADVSTWHRLQSDETWHFARGDALEIVCLDRDGNLTELPLGPGGPYVATIAAGLAFAARVRGRSGYALVTCCVAPGFDFDDFEMLDASQLAAEFPQRAETIMAFAR